MHDPVVVVSMRQLADERRAERRRNGVQWPEAGPLVEALEAAGVDTVDFGVFGRYGNSTFDEERAAPILLDWLPRVHDPGLKATMVMSLQGQRVAGGEAVRRLIAEYNRPDYADDSGLRWQIAATIASVVGRRDAEVIAEMLADRTAGSARENLCDALSRTKHPDRVRILADAIDDDAIAGHAILALRRIYRGRLGEEEWIRPRLEAVLVRPSASELALRQAAAVLRVRVPRRRADPSL